MSDLISRKDAIDEVKRLHSVAWGNWKETRISANTMIDALKDLPSAEPKTPSNGSITCVKSEKMHVRPTDDLISRQEAIRLAEQGQIQGFEWQFKKLCTLPSAEPERLTDDDFETIRIHLNAYKEKLCNQRRREEAEEYQRIIDRFIAFASAEQEIIRCRDCKHHDGIRCFRWNSTIITGFDDYCSNAERRGEEE